MLKYTSINSRKKKKQRQNCFISVTVKRFTLMSFCHLPQNWLWIGPLISGQVIQVYCRKQKKSVVSLFFQCLHSSLFPSLWFWRTSGGLTWQKGWSHAPAPPQKRGAIWIESERTFQFGLLLPAGQLPGERARGTVQHCLLWIARDLWMEKPYLHPRTSLCFCLLPVWVGNWVIAIPGALSACFQRDEIWRTPFVLYTDNNPLVSENHKGS